MLNIALPVVEFSREGYKIRKVFAGSLSSFLKDDYFDFSRKKI
jgi:hypothetical protein